MRCIYCFEKGNVNDISHMSLESLSNTLTLIKTEINKIRIDNPSIRITIELFGGEPLQERNKPLVDKIFQFARENTCYISAVTNGYDILKFIDSFVIHRDIIKSLHITLDGTEKIHNSRRKVYDKEGSFRRISNGIDLLLKLGIRVNVNTNVDKINVAYLQELFEYYRTKGWTENKKFTAIIGRVDDKYNSGSDVILSEAALQKEIINIFPKEKPPWIRLAFLKSPDRVSKALGISFNQDESGKSSYHYCWATSPIIDGCYIGANNEMFRCTTTVPSEIFKVGELGIDEYLSYQKGWLNNTCFSRHECLNCNIGGFCGGGCVIEKETKGFNVICEYEKANYNEFVSTIVIPRLKEIFLHEAKVS